MDNQLVPGQNYWYIFRIEDTPTGQLIYNGGISWTGTNFKTGAVKTIDSQSTTDKALEYISRPSYGTGVMFPRK